MTKCCLRILGLLLHYLQLQLTVIKHNYEGLLAYVGNQRSLSRWVCYIGLQLGTVAEGTPQEPFS